MKTGGPTKTAAALKRIADSMTPEQQRLYGPTFGMFADKLNSMQESGLDFSCGSEARHEIAEQIPLRARPAWPRAEEILRFVP